MPMLIYVVLQSNPEHLVSNVQYILRFRNQEKLGGEAGYYLSSLMGAVQFVENMDRTSLTITDDEFEKNVEAAVSAIAEKHQATSPLIAQPSSFSEKTEWHQPEGRPSTDGQESHYSRRSMESEGEGMAPIGGILKTIQKPLTTIGRIFAGLEAVAAHFGTVAAVGTDQRAGRNAAGQAQKGKNRSSEHPWRCFVHSALSIVRDGPFERSSGSTAANVNCVTETPNSEFPDPRDG